MSPQHFALHRSRALCRFCALFEVLYDSLEKSFLCNVWNRQKGDSFSKPFRERTSTSRVHWSGSVLYLVHKQLTPSAKMIHVSTILITALDSDVVSEPLAVESSASSLLLSRLGLLLSWVWWLPAFIAPNAPLLLSLFFSFVVVKMCCTCHYHLNTVVMA